jgi:hypothetical protein
MRGDWGGTIGDGLDGRLAIGCWKYGFKRYQRKMVMAVQDPLYDFFAENIDKMAAILWRDPALHFLVRKRLQLGLFI